MGSPVSSDAGALASWIVRAVELPAAAEPATSALATRLLALTDLVPRDSYLILGGSLARGEPTFVPSGHGYQLQSDLDLLLVFDSVLPPLSVDDFLAATRPALPTMTIMMTSRDEYDRFGTTIGYDFKNLGIPLNRRSLPPHTPVVVNERDAYELLLFCVAAYFWGRIPTRWASNDDSLAFHMEVNRLCIKVLRAGGMLSGAYNHNDVDAMPPDIRAHMAGELAWRRAPDTAPLHPGRFWPILATVLRHFDGVFGEVRPDAVTATCYEDREGAAVVAYHQRLAHALARRMLGRMGESVPEIDDVLGARQDAWAQLVELGAVRPFYSPDEYFGARSELFRDNLLAMKVTPPGSGGGTAERWTGSDRVAAGTGGA